MYYSQMDQWGSYKSCSAEAKNFTNYVFCHPQFSGVIQNIENCCAILTLIVYANYYKTNQFYKVKKRKKISVFFNFTLMAG